MARLLILSLIAAGTLPDAAASEAQVYTPPTGSAERRAIMDAMRPKFEASLGGPVIFVVKTLRVSSGYAFVEARPERPDGRPWIDKNWPWTQKADYAGAMLHWSNGRWILLDSALDPTDVWWCGSKLVPRELLPNLGPGC